MKYEVGERVRIKTGFEKMRKNGDPSINFEMKKMTGKIYTIRDRFNGDTHVRYHFSDGDWTWMEEWLEGIEPDLPDIDESDFMVMFNA